MKDLTHTFVIDMVSEINGQRYNGTFTTTKRKCSIDA